MEDLLVIRADKGLSVMTHDSFHKTLHELYDKMDKTNNKAEKEYLKDYIEDLMIKFADYSRFKNSEGVTLVGPVEDNKIEKVEDSRKVTKIMDISDARAKKEVLVHVASK